MTAFGRASNSTDIGTIDIDLQSLNRKNLDVRLYCPSELRRFEIQIQKWAARWISRGQLTVKIAMTYGDKSPVSVKPNVALAGEIKQAADAIAKEVGLDDPKFPSRLLCRHDNILSFEEKWSDESDYLEQLKETFDRAVRELVAMKRVEGAHLAEDIEQRVQSLSEWIDQVEEACADTVENRKQKLLDAIGDAREDDALLREVAFFADRVDIQEEMTRFRSHLNQFLLALDDKAPVGKKLEFIIQELFREVTTIASKSPELVVKQLTIAMRGEIERIREQVQNIE